MTSHDNAKAESRKLSDLTVTQPSHAPNLTPRWFELVCMFKRLSAIPRYIYIGNYYVTICKMLCYELCTNVVTILVVQRKYKFCLKTYTSIKNILVLEVV